MGSLSPGEGCADVISRFRPRHTHTHKSYFSPWPRLPRASPTIEFSPGRRGGPFCQGHGEGFLSPDRSWPRIMEPGSPSKPGSTSASAEERRPPLLTMFRRRAGCEPNSHHCLLLFDLATAISWRSMPCKSAVLKPDMHNGRATAGGRPGGRGEVHRSLQSPQDSQGCQSNAQVDKGSATLPPRLAATAAQILMMGSCAQSRRRTTRRPAHGS